MSSCLFWVTSYSLLSRCVYFIFRELISEMENQSQNVEKCTQNILRCNSYSETLEIKNQSGYFPLSLFPSLFACHQYFLAFQILFTWREPPFTLFLKISYLTCYFLLTESSHRKCQLLCCSWTLSHKKISRSHRKYHKHVSLKLY